MKNLLFTLALLAFFDSFGQNTIETKYTPPEGYERTFNDAYSKFLRKLPLKKNNIVKYYNGEEKYNDNIWDAVFDYKTGTHRWHQCADAAIYLKALYNYENKLYNKLSFHFTNGDLTTYNDWLSGIDYKVDSNDTNKLIKYQSKNRVDNFETFINWLTERVMLWAGTWSIEEYETDPIKIKDARPGDLFIEGGFPGHAVTIVDMVENDKGKKKFILSQSYMPSQEQQILINRENGSVWYNLDEFKDIVTPEWSFTVTQLNRFNN